MTKLKTVQIKGKSYVEVNERIKYFRQNYKDWSLESEIVDMTEHSVIIKAIVKNSDGRIIATGLAHEDKRDGYINKTSHIENCECVPLNTEILTKDGFKFYHEVKENELCLTVNPETLEYEYQPLITKSVYKSKSVVEISTSRFKAICTPNHKWITQRGLVELSEMKQSDKILLVGNKYEKQVLNASAAKLGWYFSDGQLSYTEYGLPSRCEIRQSKVENLKQLTLLFGEPRKAKTYNKKWKDSYVFTDTAENVRLILGKYGVRTYKDLPKAVSKMDNIDVYSFYHAMMAADGYSGGFGKTYIEIVEAMQIACIRLGIKTGIIKERFSKKSTKPIYILPIHKTNGAYYSELKIKNNPPLDVWCPTFENGTWIARQKNQVWVTGNTSAWGRALGNLGIGIDSSVASYEEVNTAIQKQSKIEVEKAIKEKFNAKPINKPIKQKAKLSSKDSERWNKARNYAFNNGFKSLIELYELSQSDKDLMLSQLWELCKQYAIKHGVDKLFSVFKMSEEAQQKLIKEIYEQD